MYELTKRPGESSLNYHRRLVFGKLVDKTLADYDYSEIGECLYGQAYASDVARRMLYGSRKTLEAAFSDACDDVSKDRDSCNGSNSANDELDQRIAELRIERQKMYDQRIAMNKAIRDRARDEEIYEIVEQSIKSGALPTLSYERTFIAPSNNDLLVSLNDIHYGAAHDNYWGAYDSDICKKMFSVYLDRVIAIAETHRSENCIVWENGDAISGMIHKTIQINNKENVVEQVMGVSELIADFLANLSKHFREVSFVSVAGNHSRLDSNKDAVVNGERLDDLVEWYLKARLAGFENIRVGAGRKIDPTMYTIDIRGKTYVGVHGDYDCTNNNIQSVKAMVGEPVYAIMLGHLHRNKTDSVQGVKTIMSGSFQGMDEYCIRNRLIGRPEQIVCVCTDDGILCHYDIQLEVR